MGVSTISLVFCMEVSFSVMSAGRLKESVCMSRVSSTVSGGEDVPAFLWRDCRFRRRRKRVRRMRRPRKRMPPRAMPALAPVERPFLELEEVTALVELGVENSVIVVLEGGMLVVTMEDIVVTGGAVASGGAPSTETVGMYVEMESGVTGRLVADDIGGACCLWIRSLLVGVLSILKNGLYVLQVRWSMNCALLPMQKKKLSFFVMLVEREPI